MISQHLDGVFAFHVGDFVFIRADMMAWHDNSANALYRKPIKVGIVGRHIEECHGGVQWYYAVRVGDKVCHLFEFELSATLEAQ